MGHDTAPTRPLVNGAEMPLLGLGTYPMDDAEAGAAVVHALEAGYRMIDTAENYRNEEGVGHGIARAGLARAELFITTKFNKEWHSREGVRTAWEHSATRLGLDYIDLMLIHWPNPGLGRYVEAWEGLVELLSERKVRAIGTSNFTPAQLTELMKATSVVPDVNQIQHSPWWPRHDELRFHAEHGIASQSWSPLGRGRGLLESPVVAEVAGEHGIEPARIVLRWHVQHGTVPLPKSIDPRRQRENLDVFGFSLSADQVSRLDSLAGGGPAVMDPMEFGH
ncbi:aldo/keto reductase [Zafaria sp. Z1313]|uniref:aldo/keto reductase n=1 Tax=unclassified Zafaria TaxID=2828765 RepID=UPI002E784AFD|nr:aldo/keto reductase [Zafaria sp. J156]MEE1620652.1 aldo/keto reductase [Zafaria sp. J156]